MLDLHANVITPGAVLALGTGTPTVAIGDGQTSPGVPIDEGAKLVGWGFLSPTADSIAALKLGSQDMIDPQNGESYAPGATSLLNVMWDYDQLKYESGQRLIQAGTNVGVVAGTGLLLDSYAGGNAVKGSFNMPKTVIIAPATTFAGALTTNQWGTVAFAVPAATTLPNGKYAILGALVSAITNAAAIRFAHANFKGLKPGFPVANNNIISTSSWDKIDKDPIFMQQGTQFVYLSEKLGEACCPVFTVSSTGTGLTIEMISVQADTPVVQLVLAKVG